MTLNNIRSSFSFLFLNKRSHHPYPHTKSLTHIRICVWYSRLVFTYAQVYSRILYTHILMKQKKNKNLNAMCLFNTFLAKQEIYTYTNWLYTYRQHCNHSILQECGDHCQNAITFILIHNLSIILWSRKKHCISANVHHSLHWFQEKLKEMFTTACKKKSDCSQILLQNSPYTRICLEIPIKL